MIHYYLELPSLFLFDREDLKVVFGASSEFSRGSIKVPHNEMPVNDKFGRILYDNLVDKPVVQGPPSENEREGSL